MTMNQNETTSNYIDGDLYGYMFILLIAFIILSPIIYFNRFKIRTFISRVLNRDAHVVIVSTYGPSVDGSVFYESYVKKMVDFVLEDKNKVDEIIIVGGYTVDPTRSQSQALLDYAYVKYPLFKKKNIPVTLDECGITTWENMKNAKKLIDTNFISAKKITIFGEESRSKKLAFFANGLFHPYTPPIADKERVLKQLGPLTDAPKEKQIQAYNEKLANGEYYTYIKDTYLIDKNIRIVTIPSGLSQEFVDDEHAKIFQEMKEFLDLDYGKKKVKERLESWYKTSGFDASEKRKQLKCSN